MRVSHCEREKDQGREPVSGKNDKDRRRRGERVGVSGDRVGVSETPK